MKIGFVVTGMNEFARGDTDVHAFVFRDTSPVPTDMRDKRKRKIESSENLCGGVDA